MWHGHAPYTFQKVPTHPPQQYLFITVPFIGRSHYKLELLERLLFVRPVIYNEQLNFRRLIYYDKQLSHTNHIFDKIF